MGTELTGDGTVLGFVASSIGSLVGGKAKLSLDARAGVWPVKRRPAKRNSPRTNSDADKMPSE